MSDITPEPIHPEPIQPDPVYPGAGMAEPVMPSTGQTTRGPVSGRSVPIGGIFGLIVILFLLGAGAGYYVWHDQTRQQNRRISALNAEIGALKAKTAQLAARQAHPPAPAPARLPAAAAAKIDNLQQNVAALAATIAADHSTIASLQSDVQPRLGRLQSELNDLQANLGTMPALAARAQRLDQVTTASLALQNGEPLGTIKDAPPALTRYATKAPPTEAELRREFPAAARRAAAAGGDVQATGDYWQRLKMRVAGLVTLQRHGHVLVGSRVSGSLAAARNDLDAGDISGAVARLNALPPPAKAAMRPWLDRAKGLLAARQALPAMAGTATAGATTGSAAAEQK